MISVLCPTRGRPESVHRLLDSMQGTAAGVVEVIFYVDDDDTASQDVVKLWVKSNIERGGNVSAELIVGPRILLSQAWNACWAHAKYDIGMHCGDDIVFRTPGWDVRVHLVFESIPDKIGLVWGRDGIQDEDMATHGFIHRRWVETVGYFVPALFASDYNDFWLYEVAGMIGRRFYVPEIYTEHLHFTVDKHPLDATHEERLARHREQDCDRIWAESAHLREHDAQKLREAISVFQRGAQR